MDVGCLLVQNSLELEVELLAWPEVQASLENSLDQLKGLVHVDSLIRRVALVEDFKQGFELFPHGIVTKEDECDEEVPE
jgi:hypothetical protein